MDKKMLKALNEQVTKEIASAYLYLQMAAWCDEKTLPGFANWLKIQVEEENAHGMIFFNYINERGEMVDLGAIEKPEQKYSTLLELFEKVLEHEKKVTASINNLMDIAISVKDYATQNRLAWFIEEQVEEEATVSEIIGKLKHIGNDSQSLFVYDNEMAGRTFVTPSPLAKA